MPETAQTHPGCPEPQMAGQESPRRGDPGPHRPDGCVKALLRNLVSNPVDRNFFRFSYDHAERYLFMNFFESTSKNWTDKLYN